LPRRWAGCTTPSRALPSPAQAVTRGEGEALAREYGMAFFETSAKKDIGVSEAFMSIARQVVSRLGDSGPRSGGNKAVPSGGRTEEKVDISKKNAGGDEKKKCC
jgi:Ras-related protein Rab-8A